MRSAGFVDSKENTRVSSQQSRSKEGTARHRQSKEASILWSHHEQTRELRGERDNARNNARCTDGLDGQHQDVSIRMTEDRDQRRNYVHGVAERRIEDDRCRTTTDLVRRLQTAHLAADLYDVIPRLAPSPVLGTARAHVHRRCCDVIAVTSSL